MLHLTKLPIYWILEFVTSQWTPWPKGSTSAKCVLRLVPAPACWSDQLLNSLTVALTTLKKSPNWDSNTTFQSTLMLVLEDFWFASWRMQDFLWSRSTSRSRVWLAFRLIPINMAMLPRDPLWCFIPKGNIDIISGFPLSIGRVVSMLPVPLVIKDIILSS